ncbi:Hypothetical protein GLP15_2647 [Giardia lamblia P15]|uniref:Uncharacterized protein n=1 Tax=Giardia intestinalis (strain P15) TaxID=658858 RepID=E1F7X6_GIAIA|nr:Hypothetical protein GLP15_2647 [Giardia lamblia P15]
MAHVREDPFYNIPDIVTKELQQIRSNVSLLEVKCTEVEKKCANLQSENTLLREQLLETTQLLANYPTNRDYDALKASITQVSNNLWQPTAPFINQLKQQLLSELQASLQDFSPENRVSKGNLSVVLAEHIALELSPIYTKISSIEEALQSKANKRTVIATIKQRFEEIASMVTSLQESLADVLGEKADMESVSDALLTKVDTIKLPIILDPYLKTETFNQFKQEVSADESILSRISKIELKIVAQQQALEEVIRTSVSVAMDKLQEQIGELEVLVRANTATISRACASADAAMADVRLLRSDGIEETNKAYSQMLREIQSFSSRLSNIETDIIRKVDHLDFQAMQRRIQAQLNAERSFSQDHNRPTIGQVRQMIAESIDSVIAHRSNDNL